MMEVELMEENLIDLSELKYGNVVHLAPPLTETVYPFVTLKTIHYFKESNRQDSYYQMDFEWIELDSPFTISILSSYLQEKVYFVKNHN